MVGPLSLESEHNMHGDIFYTQRPGLCLFPSSSSPTWTSSSQLHSVSTSPPLPPLQPSVSCKHKPAQPLAQGSCNFSHAQHPPPYPTSTSPLAQSCLCCSDAQPPPTLANHCIKPHASSPSCFTDHEATASTTRSRGLTRSHWDTNYAPWYYIMLTHYWTNSLHQLHENNNRS